MSGRGQGSARGGPEGDRQAAGALLVRGGTVVTLGERNLVLPAHDVLVGEGRIAAIAPSEPLGDRPPGRVLDAVGGLVMPGFINAHTHFYSSFARGLGKAPPARDFREVLEHLWWRLDRRLTPGDCHDSALVALIDAVRHGTTTLIDHHVSPGAVERSLDEVAEAVRLSGLRACLCYEVSDRDGEAVADAGIAENERFAARCRDGHDERLRALFGLHASFTLSDATLERVARLAAGQAAGCHVHVAEAASDQEETLRVSGMRVVERLHRHGILGPKTIAAHCVHVDDREIALLASSGAAVVHNPQSNMNNAVGVADVPRMSAGGVLVGLGTDAMTVDMREELRAAVWSQRLARRDPSAGFATAVAALTRGNARIAERLWPGLGLGELRVGGAADLVVLDYDPPTPLGADNFAGHLVFGLASAPVRATVVAGRVLMAGGRLELDLDVAGVMARARERAAALWERF